MKKSSISKIIDLAFPYLLFSSAICYFYKTAFWPLTFLFITSFTLAVILFLLKHKKVFFIKEFFIKFRLPLILTGMMIALGIAFNNLTHKALIKDLLLVAILFSFYYLFYWNSVIMQYKIPLKFITHLIVLVTLFICVLNILHITSLITIPQNILVKLHISEGNSISEDYNFFSLFLIIGLIVLIYTNHKNIVLYPQLFIFAITFFFIINIVLSGSRRGIFVLIILIIGYLIQFIPVISRHIKSLISFKRLIILFFFSIIAIISLLYIFERIPKQKISIMVFRYSNFFGKNNFNETERNLWEPTNKISKVIDSSSFVNHLRIYPETWRGVDGNSVVRVKIIEDKSVASVRIRKNADGTTKIYPKVNAKIYLANHTYNLSFKIKILKGDINAISCGWWGDDGSFGNSLTTPASQVDSLNNGWYSYSADYTFIDNQIGKVIFINYSLKDSEFLIDDFLVTDFDYSESIANARFNSRKRDINVITNWINDINPPIYYGSNLLMNGDFRYGFKYWSFSADSLLIKSEKSDSITYARIKRGDGNGGYYSLFYTGRKIEFRSNDEYQLSFKLKPITPDRIPFFVGFWIDEGEGVRNNLELKLDTLKNGWINVVTRYRFKNTLSNLIFPINSQIDNSEFLITGLNLINLTENQNIDKSVLEVNTSSTNDVLLSGRKSRFEFAQEVWRTNYKWYHKLFGHGFNYYEWFGKKFLDDPARGDYPHNPIISIILYSGILGFTVYVIFLFKIFSYYIINYKKLRIFSICFIITFFFSFFSSSSPFDPPIMGFFALLPYYISQINTIEINS